MEALLILGAEFLAALIGLFIVGLQLLAALTVLLIDLLARLLHWRPADRRPTRPPRLTAQQCDTLRRFGRITRRTVLGLLAVSFVGLLLANYVFLDETVAFAVRRIETRTGMLIRYERMDGDVFRGGIAFTGLHVKQESNDTARFDLHVSRAAAEFSFWHLLMGRKTLRSVEIEGVRGNFVRLRQGVADPARDDDRDLVRVRVERRGAKARVLLVPSPKAFRIDHLTIADGAFSVEDRTQPTPITYPVTITIVDAQPLRSTFLWFDLLYRSNIDLTVDGTKVVVENRVLADERHTLWSMTRIKAPVLASVVGGPFVMFSEGEIDVRAEDTWTLEREAEISMDWKLRLRDVRALVPRSTPALLQAPAGVFVAHVNAREEPWELGFTLTLREGQFAGAATLDARQIWSGALEAFLKDSIGIDDFESDAFRARARSGLNRFQEFIKNRDETRANEAETVAPRP